jgi:hypothetical protein
MKRCKTEKKKKKGSYKLARAGKKEDVDEKKRRLQRGVGTPLDFD